ncbi:MAG TPA: GlsB/YeaQ/YmgE family stress response membrane protein [Polyangia bacterium]|nr:GlsB/YeaQ/YmgE family stress response membrane protein [Polyangia bacterium]
MWVIIGALAGWIGSKVMGTDAQQGGLANVIIGVIGAVIGGFVTRAFFGDSHSNNGFIASLLVATLGSVVLIGLYKALTGSRVIR